METAIDKIRGEKFCEVYTSDKKYVPVIEQWLIDYPDEVQFMYRTQDDNGPAIAVRVPAKLFRFVSPPRKHNMSEEQKQAAAERMKAARAAKRKE